MKSLFRRRVPANALFYNAVELSPPLGGRPKFLPGLGIILIALVAGLVIAFFRH
jgi:hypothetical protein